MQQDYNNAELIKKVRTEKNFSFAKNTTYGLGGRARIAYYPQTENEVAAVFDYLKDNGEKFVILGAGSNVLASDKFFDGAVISTKSFKKILIKDNFLYCTSGVSVSELLNFCIKNCLSGLEYLAGIPASVGGLCLMNGGTFDKRICENVLNLRVYDGKMHDFTNKNCNFGNKHSIMRDISCIILGAELAVEYSVNVEEKINYYLKARRSQPKGRSCGCVFKNTQSNISAGKIIDSAGLKGLTIGSARVSEKHANFIISNGNCAADVFKLIKKVKREVYERMRIDLEEEVVYIGEFNDFDS